jgi:uncharacterized membrane protein
VVDRVEEGFEGTQMALIATNLSADDEQKLREAFGDE